MNNDKRLIAFNNRMHRIFNTYANTLQKLKDKKTDITWWVKIDIVRNLRKYMTPLVVNHLIMLGLDYTHEKIMANRKAAEKKAGKHAKS